MIEVVPYSTDLSAEWARFLAASNNGTIFHDLRFLAYHPPGRFDQRHLLFRLRGETVALLPAALVEVEPGVRWLKSPFGASVGGPVLPVGQPVETTMAVACAVREHARVAGLGGIEMRLGPAVYMSQPDDHLGFALAAAGFKLHRRWISHVVRLPSDPREVEGQFKRPKARDILSALRKGAQPREASRDSLPAFYDLLLGSKRKHGATPTHTQAEIESLFELLPARIRLFMCEASGQEVAGVLVFMLNSRAAYTFYICQAEPPPIVGATAALIAHLGQVLAGEGIRYLDLGPTSFDDMSLSSGLAFFKEGFGAVGFCRDEWRWTA